MRVLVLYDFPIKGGGSGYYVRYLMKRLKENHKCELGIVLPDSKPVEEASAQFAVPIKNPPVFIGRPGLERSQRYSDITASTISDHLNKYIQTTLQAVEEFKPDVIHVHHLGINAWAARFIKATCGVPYIITSHGSCLANIVTDRRYYLLTKDAIRGASSVTLVSGDSREKFVKLFGSEFNRKLRTIPGGVAISLFPNKISKREKAEIRQKYDLPEGPLVFFTGRLISEKGVDYLIKAAEKINANIVIVGDGSMKKAYQSMIKKLHITNVSLLGYIDHEDLIRLYYLADVYVGPSIWDDPMPLTVIEAMASKTPLVVTKKGGIPLAVKDHFNGLFVRPRNSSDIAEKVNYLLENPELCAKMGERSREIVERKFTWTKIASRFFQLYTRA